MFSYEFFKTASLYSYKSLKKLKSLKTSHEIFVNFHNSFQKFEILNKDSQFIEKFIDESFNFLFQSNIESSSAYTRQFEFSKIVVKTLSNALNFIIKAD